MRPKHITAIGLLACVLLLFTNNLTHQTSAQDRPNPTPTSTPVRNLLLPDWMRDSDTNVLVTFAYESNDSKARPTFLNVRTGDRFIIDWSYVDKAGWVQAEDGLYIRLSRFRSSGADNSDGFNEFINLQTGDLTRLPLQDDREPQAINQTGESSLDNGEGLKVSWSVTASVNPTGGEGSHVVNTRLHLKLSESQDGEETTLREWPASWSSRVDAFSVRWLGHGAYLGIWTGQQSEDGITGTITVYDTDGTLLMDFNDVSKVRWFQGDELLILYTQTDFVGKTICWAEVARYRRNCRQLVGWERENRAEIQSYDWSKDGQSIIFSYEHTDTESGGLCIYGWEGERAHCSVDYTVTEGQFRGAYFAEPSDTYGIYSYGNIVDYWDTRLPREGRLCMVHRETFAVDCITDDELPPDTYYRSRRWSPSRRYLAFTYTGQNYAGQDGLCIFDTETAAIACPVSAEDLQNGFIEDFSWSPDSRYIAIMNTAYGPLSDDKTFSRFGIVDVENNSYRDEGFAFYEHRLDELWRPLLE